MKRLLYFIEAMRPHQWYKNLIVFIGIVFSKRILDAASWYDVISVFFLLCAFSAVTYIINDILDFKRDWTHPQKRKRAIASGRISKQEAGFGSAVVLALAFYWSSLLDQTTFAALMVFFATGLLYNVYLKHIFLVDIITISVLFVMRATIGVLSMPGAVISPWLILCAFLLSLLLALGKRRRELQVLKEDSISHRKVLEHYSLEIITPLVISTLAMLFVSYCIYTVLTETGREMVITIPVITYLFFRYAYIIFSGSDVAANPERVFQDRGMLYGIILWILLVLVSLYVLPAYI